VSTLVSTGQPLERRAIVVTGVVQGVGFRPFVHRVATDLGLSGFVQNAAGEVRIEAEGSATELEHFLSRLSLDAPPLARIEGLCVASEPPRGEAGFRILESHDVGTRAFVAADVAPCDACLRELLDPADRRYRYPFINCTDCGPRLTIVEGAPYDRARTTLRHFPLCDACRAEYEAPTSRRFHAEANACPSCGPRLRYWSSDALADAPTAPTGDDALATAVRRLRDGAVLAIKGVGGYHLACSAANASAVARLRRGKARDDKPFALMVADHAMAGALVELTPVLAGLLASPARPIVLGARRPEARVAEGVARGSPWLGLMLPSAPLHHLLLGDLGEPLVMTSGNLCHEPMAYEDEDARVRLAPLVDGWLTHNRPIRTRCDDSVVRPLDSGPLLLRRARGLAPEPLRLERPLVRPLLALGGASNVTFALGRERHVFVSHHVGDVEDYAAYHALGDALERYEELFGSAPELVAHDLHPDYPTSALARRWAVERGLATLAVQHHHAHVASVMLEHALEEPVLGVAFDGTGLGSDGTLWGGEFLLADRHGFERVAHLRAVPVPGGDQAVREPWRMALAYARDAGASLSAPASVDHARFSAVSRLLEARAFCPPSSSAGRLFDAVAAIAGVRHTCHYDGQPAIELEWAALRAPEARGVYDFELARASRSAPWVVDTRPLIRDVVRDVERGTSPEDIARRFHRTLVALVIATLERLRDERGVRTVVLGGGVFANGILTDALVAELPERGFEVHRPRRFPPGDGGLCLGQLAVAAAHAERQGAQA
jgi:hydrogenase maturation protein HypF